MREHLTRQHLSHRLNIANPYDEIDRLTHVINDLCARFEENSRSQQRFIANATHELRSPLANLQLALEYALRRQHRPEAYQAILQSALGDVQRLTTLVRDLLTLSRADSGRLDLIPRPVALHELLQQLVAAYQLRAQEKAMTLTLAIPEIIVNGDAARLQQLFANLLENALRYTPAYGTVAITGARLGNAARVAVTDTGRGIAPEHLPHLFERFYRVDKDHAREGGGSGLGLAICQEIVRAHDGTLTVQSTPGAGTTFTVTLPLAVVDVP
jgi:signal transduction histidine kinase